MSDPLTRITASPPLPSGVESAQIASMFYLVTCYFDYTLSTEEMKPE